MEIRGEKDIPAIPLLGERRGEESPFFYASLSKETSQCIEAINLIAVQSLS